MLESSYASCCLFQLLSHNAVNEQQKQSKSIQSCRHDLWRGGCQSKPQPGVHLLAGSEAFDTITDIFNGESRRMQTYAPSHARVLTNAHAALVNRQAISSMMF